MKYDISPDMGEFAGIFMGDGFANNHGNHYIVDITGNSKNEMGYYRDKIIPLISGLFQSRPHMRVIGNTIRLRYNSKEIFRVIQKLGLITGKKR
jgi:hypothetical protein